MKKWLAYCNWTVVTYNDLFSSHLQGINSVVWFLVSTSVFGQIRYSTTFSQTHFLWLGGEKVCVVVCAWSHLDQMLEWNKGSKFLISVETDPLQIFATAIENCKPVIGVVGMKRAGTVYQVGAIDNNSSFLKQTEVHFPVSTNYWLPWQHETVTLGFNQCICNGDQSSSFMYTCTSYMLVYTRSIFWWM